MARRCVVVRGLVQGVGFRPFVYDLATRHQLHGFVRNQSGAVQIEVEGDPGDLKRFCDDLVNEGPPLAVIHDISVRVLEPRDDHDFRIERSSCESAGPVYISPDVATCNACLAELADPADRRYGYPFLNCTNCGPRLTIICGAPYDRARTTMARFEMCPECRAEFEDPQNQRFHAQPTACAQCGPQLRLTNGQGDPIESSQPLTFLIERLREGQMAALKGLGGYHLVCDARNDEAVCELRRRKARDDKPFAVMVFDTTAARVFAECDAQEEALLRSSARPIVLLRRRHHKEVGIEHDGIAPSVAPGNPRVGIFFPYTPLHWLLLNQAAGMPLVMTSGNRSDDPIAYEDHDALTRLGEIADLFLVHDRPIHVRCDDSVVRIVAGAPSFVRRSRGYAPNPIKLPLACDRHVLAVGGQFKGTFALGRDDVAFVSHHLGDLDHFEAYRAFERDERLYEELFEIHPKLVVHDLHPDYASTRYARHRAAKEGLATLAVQHHHAHIASCLAEHGLDETAIGVAFDGTGFGTDGAIWGGEFLLAGLGDFRRIAHLRYVPLPGGDQAIREPWRSAATHLIDAGVDRELLASAVDATALRTVERMIERRLNTVPTSSAGRLFDAIAALVGLRSRVTYEGQAAMELEWQATDVTDDGDYPFEFLEPTTSDPAFVVDTRPLIRAVADDKRRGVETGRMARRFHSTLVEIIVRVCQRIRNETEVSTVALSGGVWMNALLAEETAARLAEDQFRVFTQRQVPPNDGGLSLGQLAVAAARLRVSQLDRA